MRIIEILDRHWDEARRVRGTKDGGGYSHPVALALQGNGFRFASVIPDWNSADHAEREFKRSIIDLGQRNGQRRTLAVKDRLQRLIDNWNSNPDSINTNRIRFLIMKFGTIDICTLSQEEDAIMRDLWCDEHIV